jgi:ACS family glucarate transporter-like MFS transporter
MSYVPHARSTHVRYVVMAFLCGLSFLTYFDRVCVIRASNDIQHTLNIGDQQMGLVFSAFWLAYALFDIPSGWMGDRFGTRSTLTRIVLAWSLFTALSGAAAGLTSLLIYRFLFGAGEAGAYPNMARIQSRWLPIRSRGRAGGMLWLLARWGAAFSPLLFGTLLRGADAPTWRALLHRLHLPHAVADAPAWRMGFWFSGLMGLAWVALFLPFFRDDPADKRSVNEAELTLIRAGRPADDRDADAGHGHVMNAGVWKALFMSPSLWGLAVLYLTGSFGYSFFVSWMPKYFEKVQGVSFEKSEWMNAGPQFCAGIACLLGGILSDWLVRAIGRKRIGRAVFPIAGCTIAAAAMFGIRIVHTPHAAVALMCVAAAAYDFGQAANWATIIDVGGRYAGTAAGFINTVGNMGNALQPVIGAAVFIHFGWGALFACYAGAYLVAGSTWIIIDPTKTFYRDVRPTRSVGFPVITK